MYNVIKFIILSMIHKKFQHLEENAIQLSTMFKFNLRNESKILLFIPEYDIKENNK